MSDQGILFSLSEEDASSLLKVDSKNIVEYVIKNIEEVFFNTKDDLYISLDYSWDAIQRCFNDGNLEFCESGDPLKSIILGGTILYGKSDDENNYILTLKSPQQVKEIYKALLNISRDDFRKLYFNIKDEDYDFTVDEDDFEYTCNYFFDMINFLKTAVENNSYILFAVEQ